MEQAENSFKIMYILRLFKMKWRCDELAMKRQEGRATMQKWTFVETTVTFEIQSWKLDAEKIDIVRRRA